MSARAAAARAKCLTRGYDKPPVTFDAPSASWAKHYEQSILQETLFALYNPLVLHFGGYIQSAIEGGDALRVGATLHALGSELKAAADERDYDPFEATCLAGCVVNELLSADEEPLPNASIDFALAEGYGDCKHFASTSKILLEEMGIRASLIVSLDHAFNRMKVGGVEYDFDLLWGSVPYCNFMRRSD